MLRLLVLLTTAATVVRAARSGDEMFGDDEYGKFWAFHSAGVSIINPDTCKVETTIIQDRNEEPLPSRWFDAVFIELDPVVGPDGTEEEPQGYVGINSAILLDTDAQGQTSGAGETLILSTNGKDRGEPVVSRIIVGPRPVHVYSVQVGNQVELWSHSDVDGQFYIVDMKNVRGRRRETVQSFVERPAHVTLMWDRQDEHLRTAGPNGGPIGFGTSTMESHLLVFDLTNKELITTFDLSTVTTSGTCSGTHSISYSEANKHVYLECVQDGGILEINVADALNPVFVNQLVDIKGTVWEIPSKEAINRFIVVTDKDKNLVHILTPGINGQPSQVSYNANVPGHPESPSFWTDGENNTLCMPLTENTNVHHRNKEEEILCDYYGCSGAKTEDDVDAGLCLYNSTGDALLTVDLSQINLVASKAPPFNTACANCLNENDYDKDTGLCTCTPECGSCAEDEFDAANTGLRCFNWTGSLDIMSTIGGDEVPVSLDTPLLIKKGGAVKQGSPNVSSPECGFGQNFRPHKRGYIYDASVAHVPIDSIVIVDMSTQKVHCQVELPGTPSTVIYVPTRGKERSDFIEERKGDTDDGVKSGVRAGIVTIGVVLLSLMAIAVAYCGEGRKQNEEHRHLHKDNEEENSDNGEIPPSSSQTPRPILREEGSSKAMDSTTADETSRGGDQQGKDIEA